MNEINCIKKDQSLIHETKNFFDFGIVALNFAGEDRERRHSVMGGTIMRSASRDPRKLRSASEKY